MMYFDFEAGNKVYKLRLTTRAIMALEAKIGCNPLMIFGAAGNRIPTITEMVHILHNSLTHFNHGITYNDAMDIFDAWIGDGHTPTDFISVIIDVFKASGIMPNTPETSEADSEDNEKN